MPESVPGLKRKIGSAGHSGRTSDQFVGGRVDQGEFFECDVFSEIVFRTNNHCQSINTNLEFNRLTIDTFAGFHFGVFDLAGGIGNIGFASYAEAFNTSARTNAVDGQDFR